MPELSFTARALRFKLILAAPQVVDLGVKSTATQTNLFLQSESLTLTPTSFLICVSGANLRSQTQLRQPPQAKMTSTSLTAETKRDFKIWRAQAANTWLVFV